MLLVFCAKISPRVRYIFHHVLTVSLGIPIDFTSKIDVFIAHAGPKLSYGKAPLGNEFFLESVDLLFEYGIQNIPLEVKAWEELSCFFSVGKKSKLPFDLFAASFYLLSRYEEYLPHRKDEWGRFKATESLAFENNFLEQPLVDLWIEKFFSVLIKSFPALQKPTVSKERFLPLIEVESPYKYKHKSIFANLVQWLRAIFQLDLWAFIEQPMVLFGFRKDPWDNFDLLTQYFSLSSFKLRFFFLYSSESYMDRGISFRNRAFQEKIKHVADYFETSLLASYSTLSSEQKLEKENVSLATLIHRSVHSIRYAWGIKATGESYRYLIKREIAQDFSMGYDDYYGYRASTSVPFFLYDISTEMTSSLKIYPVVCNEKILRKYSPIEALKKLQRSEEQLPLPIGVHAFAVSNCAFESSELNNSFRSLLLDYMKAHDE